MNRNLSRILPLIDGLLCAVLLVLMLVDLIWPLADLFLNGFVKVLVLLACLLTAACGLLLIARQRRQAWGRRTARPRPLWLLGIAHVVALGLALVLYALPHHVIPHGEAAVGVVSSRGGAEQTVTVSAWPADADAPAEEETGASAGSDAQPAQETEEALEDTDVGSALTDAGDASGQAQSAAPIQEDAAALQSLFGTAAVGSFRNVFGDVFTDGEVKKTDSSYRSGNISVNVDKRYLDELHAWVYVADIYVADISCLTTAFAQDRYGRGYTEWITDVAARYNGVVTVNGDYYGTRSAGIIIRNGQLYRDKHYNGDVCILYWDGHMEAKRGSRCNGLEEMDRGAYQSWSFGPSLLDASGKPLGDFNCSDSVRKRHPRSAIGYYEPGHYCFVTVDGRNDESRGSTLTDLATLMSNLGCKLAYNLDGGQTSLMAVGDRLINNPSAGGRNSSDYILIVDRVTQ